jgi:nucleoside-diphosphate-sugar epimerase
VRVVVIGGTGHIGSYLVPRLVRAGHEVVSISRGQSQPYLADDGWAAVKQLELDKDAEEQRGTFGERVAGLRPDAVVDLLCYTMDSATQLAAALRGSPAYLLHCGTIWVLGPATAVPVPLTMRGFAAAAAAWFGQEARLRYEPWETWRQQHDPEDVEHTRNHLRHSPCISMAKAARLLGYAPRYSSLDALHEAVTWLAEHGQIEGVTR